MSTPTTSLYGPQNNPSGLSKYNQYLTRSSAKATSWASSNKPLIFGGLLFVVVLIVGGIAVHNHHKVHKAHHGKQGATHPLLVAPVITPPVVVNKPVTAPAPFTKPAAVVSAPYNKPAPVVSAANNAAKPYVPDLHSADAIKQLMPSASNAAPLKTNSTQHPGVQAALSASTVRQYNFLSNGSTEPDCPEAICGKHTNQYGSNPYAPLGTSEFITPHTAITLMDVHKQQTGSKHVNSLTSNLMLHQHNTNQTGHISPYM